MRARFAQVLKQKFLNSSNNVILLGDISVGLFLDGEELVENAFNMGILEQSMISFAAGLSKSLDNTFVHTISPFIIERAYEQIKLDIAYNKNKVVLVSANGPYDYSKLGPTHHCASDVPLISLIPEFQIFLPGREAEVDVSLERIKSSRSPAYLRLNGSPCGAEIEPNTIYGSSSSLNIYVGECLNLLDPKSTHSALYLYSINDAARHDLSTFDSITVYEPYSRPIVGEMIVKQYPGKDTNFWYYPESIESGVFTSIPMVKG